MELEDLVLFLAVVRCGGVTRAAATAGFTQSTLSRRIKRLEEELGQDLLDRSTSPVVPTAAGLHLVEFAEDVVRAWDRLHQSLGRPEQMAGELRIAASSAPARGVATALVSEFMARYPRIRTRLTLMSSRAVEASLTSHRVQVGFSGAAPSDCCLHAAVVGEDEICLVVPRTPRFDAVPDTLSVSMLDELPFVQREEGSGTLDAVRRALAGAGQSGHLHVALEVDSAEAMLSAVAAGAGAAFVSNAFLDQRDPPGVRRLELEGVTIRRPLYFVYDPVTVSRDPVAALFRQFMAGRISDPGIGIPVSL